MIEQDRNQKSDTVSKKHGKRRFKKRYWLLIDLAVILVVFVLLLYQPARYRSEDTVHKKQISEYVTNILLPDIYNGVQRQEPFEIVIPQKHTKDIVSLTDWPKASGSISFSEPIVLFESENIVFMGVANLKGMELVVTVTIKPGIDEKGLLNLLVTKVKVGAVNITPIAKLTARKMYADQLAAADVDTKDIRAQIAASVFNNEAFEPIFKIDKKKVRIKKINVGQEKMAVRMEPVFE